MSHDNSLDWDLLLERIKAGKCTPFLGAGACFGRIPLGSEIAQGWAEIHDYPLDDCRDLTRVAQFLAIKRDPMAPKEMLLRQHFVDVDPPDFDQPNEIHGLLADMPIPIYITTNYDSFMMQALKQRKHPPKHPHREICRWNKLVREEPSILDDEHNFEPTAENPVVFHLHGHDELPESMVLTEDDYLDFVIGISKDPDLIPRRIQRAFTGTSLLFLGYSLADWNFRVVFRSLLGYLEKSLARVHVSVQLLPVERKEMKEAATRYLNRYFEKLNVQMYWGTCREFAAEVRRRWQEFNHGD